MTKKKQTQEATLDEKTIYKLSVFMQNLLMLSDPRPNTPFYTKEELKKIFKRPFCYTEKDLSFIIDKLCENSFFVTQTNYKGEIKYGLIG